MQAMGAMTGGGSGPVVVSEAIYAAATDGADQLRYSAGDDAAEFMRNRKLADDATSSRG